MMHILAAYLGYPLLGVLEALMQLADASCDICRAPCKLLRLRDEHLQLCDLGAALL